MKVVSSFLAKERRNSAHIRIEVRLKAHTRLRLWVLEASSENVRVWANLISAYARTHEPWLVIPRQTQVPYNIRTGSRTDRKVRILIVSIDLLGGRIATTLSILRGNSTK